MKYLLDTQALVWALFDSQKLPEEIIKLIGDGSEVFYSIISLWEIQLKHSIAPDNLAFTARDVKNSSDNSRYRMLGFKPEHIYTVQTLDKIPDTPDHKDPFDRMLLAQAKIEEMKFISCDEKMKYYNEDFIISFRKR